MPHTHSSLITDLKFAAMPYYHNSFELTPKRYEQWFKRCEELRRELTQKEIDLLTQQYLQ